MRRTGLHGAGTRRRGAPLWLYLTALVLIPLLGLAVLAVATVRSRMSEAAGAERAEAAVRAVAQLDSARSGVEHEVVPALSRMVLDDPVTVAGLGLAPSALSVEREKAQSDVWSSRAATDAALALVPGDTVGAAPAHRAARQLHALRARADSGTLPLADLYAGYLRISDALTDAQGRAATEAGSEDVSAATMAASRDVQRVAGLAQAASRKMPLFVSA
jgi:hypothetical protein